MDRASDHHGDADTIEMGDEGSAGVVDDGDRSWPEAQVGRARFEESARRNDDETSPGESFGIGEGVLAFVGPDREILEDVSKLGELAAVLEQDDTTARLWSAGLAHELALPFPGA